MIRYALIAEEGAFDLGSNSADALSEPLANIPPSRRDPTQGATTSHVGFFGTFVLAWSDMLLPHVPGMRSAFGSRFVAVHRYSGGWRNQTCS